MTHVQSVWQWERPVTTWADAEQMAAAHMRHLGFADVLVTGGGSDRGLDVVAHGAAAQVKFRTTATGSPDINRLQGAAQGLGACLFYAMAFTAAAHQVADEVGMALFVYDTDGPLVTPANAHANSLAPPVPVMLERTAWGRLTLEARQQRAIAWAQQVQDATSAPISNRRRKGARQLQARAEAMGLQLAALALVEDSDSPLYKKARRERTIAEAEKVLRRAAKLVGVRLR